MNENLESIVNEEIVENLIQLKDHSSQGTAEWEPAICQKPAGGRHFIHDILPSGKFSLLRIPHLNGHFCTNSTMEGILGWRRSICNMKRSKD